MLIVNNPIKTKTFTGISGEGLTFLASRFPLQTQDKYSILYNYTIIYIVVNGPNANMSIGHIYKTI